MGLTQYQIDTIDFFINCNRNAIKLHDEGKDALAALQIEIFRADIHRNKAIEAIFEYDCFKKIVAPDSDSPDSHFQFLETLIAELETLKGNGKGTAAPAAKSSYSFFTTPVKLFSVATATLAVGAIATGVLAALGIAAAITTPVGIALGAAAALAIVALVCKFFMDLRENKAPAVTNEATAPAHPL